MDQNDLIPADVSTDVKPATAAKTGNVEEEKQSNLIKRFFFNMFRGFSEWHSSTPFEQRIRFYFSYLVVIGVGLVTFMTFTIANIMIIAKGIWEDIAREHFAAIIGLPSAAAAALFLVLVLSTTSGDIEFEGLSFKFRGAAGPLAFWIACFLAITLAIKLVW